MQIQQKQKVEIPSNIETQKLNDTFPDPCERCGKNVNDIENWNKKEWDRFKCIFCCATFCSHKCREMENNIGHNEKCVQVGGPMKMKKRETGTYDNTLFPEEEIDWDYLRNFHREILKIDTAACMDFKGEKFYPEIGPFDEQCKKNLSPIFIPVNTIKDFWKTVFPNKGDEAKRVFFQGTFYYAIHEKNYRRRKIVMTAEQRTFQEKRIHKIMEITQAENKKK